MTRKDYELIANAMAETKPTPFPGSLGTRLDAWTQVVHKLAFDLGNDNPRFDSLRFRRACGEEI